jgi:hypothetical protein
MAVARELGVPKSTLWAWRAEVARVAVMEREKRPSRDPDHPDNWTAEQKLEAVMKTRGLDEEELGEYMRKHGLHEAHLEGWRLQVESAALERLAGTEKKKRDADRKRVRELEKELERKDKALAETAALLVLKKKAQEIWGDEDDDTEPESGS